MYQEGYVRTSSNKYSEFNDTKAANLEEQLAVQLTNNAIQKNSLEYQKYEEGNIISLDQLFHFLSQAQIKNNSKSKGQLKTDFMNSSKQLILDSLMSVKGKVNMTRKGTFELLGYDFIMDE